MLTKIDDVAALGEIVYTVYDVKYSDPRALRDRLSKTFEMLTVMTGAEGVSGLSYTDLSGAGGGTAATTGDDGGKLSAGISAISGKPVYTPRELVSVPMKLIISGPRDSVDAALTMLNSIDLPIPQVQIEARIVDATKEEMMRAGISWDLVTGSAVKIINLNNSQPAGGDGSPFNSVTTTITGRGWGGDVIATLDKAIAKANFISRPNVVATDGRESVVFIGDVVRYIKSIQVTPTGTNIEVGEEEVGVKLNVMPRVGGDGSITLEVQPTVSFIRSFLDTGTGGQIPITAVRTARSTMRLADGETVAIGGLITDEVRKEVSGIPILMDLPIIGQLFRRTTNSKRQGEIIIFLSAKIIEGTNISSGATVAPATGDKGKG
jgi:type II secretory pathway component GspD/PulD (secretin)